MAMPPTPVPAPTPAAGAAPADMAPATSGVAPGDADEGAEPDVILTVCKDPAGGFTLYKGDEPEEDEGAVSAAAGASPGAAAAPAGDEGESEGQHFDSPQELLRGIMELLNSDSGADDAFAAGFKGTDDTPGDKPPGM